MGCCESKLLGIEDTSAKYEAGPISINTEYQDKQMVKIGVDQLTNKDNRSSLCTLRSNLEQALKQFEREKGPITLTFLNAQNKPTVQVKRKTQCKRIQNSNQTNRSADLHTNMDQVSQNSLNLQQSSQSQHFQNNTNILSNTSIQTKRQLEKQLFYINSNQIGDVKLMKWTEEDRLICQIDKEELFSCVGSNLDFVGGIYLVRQYQQKNSINLMLYKQEKTGLGFRIFMNGIKRMLNIPIQSSQNILLRSIQKIPQILNRIDSCLTLWVFLMTGWIPEIINISNFENTKEILRKLNQNFNFGNLMVAFSSKTSQQILLTEAFNTDLEQVTVLKIGKNQPNMFQHQKLKITWKNILQNHQYIYVNWNPSIYSFAKKVQGVGRIKQFQSGDRIITVPKFRVSIPSSKSQVEVRMLVQIHQSSNLKIKQFEFVLYQSNKNYINFEQKHVALRTSTSINPLFLSEIFMFEQFEEGSQYILAVKVKDYESGDEILLDTEFQITIDMLTFFQIKAEFMKDVHLIAEQEIVSTFNPSHAGFGMNSPFFMNNLQYSMSTSLGKICNIKIKIDADQPVLFEICILPDKENEQDLTFIKPQQLVRDTIQSDEFQTEAQFEFTPKTQKSIIIVVCFTPAHGRVMLKCEHYALEEKHENQNSCFQLHEISPKIEFWREFNFSWSELSPGPRKRTMENSEFKFYPIETFGKFFENPYIDYYLPEGHYQFSVISKKFVEESTDSTELQCSEPYYLKLLHAVPPSLSMGVYQLSDLKDKVKIVIDDYEYVPYGIGFWTPKLKLAGLYRFVLSKMQKQEEEGIFRIRKFQAD